MFINRKIIEEIKDAVEYALESPFPAELDLYTDVSVSYTHLTLPTILLV